MVKRDIDALNEEVASVIKSSYPEFNILCGRLTCEPIYEDIHGIFFGVYRNEPTVVIVKYDDNEYHLLPLTDYRKGWNT